MINIDKIFSESQSLESNSAIYFDNAIDNDNKRRSTIRACNE